MTTTAEVFSNYLGLTPENAPWAWTRHEDRKGNELFEPTLTATSPLAPEPTPGWRERMEQHRAFIALERLCAPRMYRATCLIYGNGKYQGETVKFDEPHPTHAVARALITSDPTLREACERASDYEKETNA